MERDVDKSMPNSHEKDMLSKVKRTFLRMASPFEYGSDEKPFNSVLTVNIPPMLARADAAYERGTAILKTPFFHADDAARTQIYAALRTLFGTAEQNLRNCDEYAQAEKRKLKTAELSKLYAGLARLSGQLETLAQEQADYADASRILSSLAGKNVLPALQDADSVFSDAEIRLCHFLADLAAMTEVPISKLRSQYKLALAKPDLERYAKSYAEYVLCYAKLGIPSTDTEEKVKNPDDHSGTTVLRHRE